MAVIRVEKTKNYTVMSNYHLRDKNLSLKAKGLLSFMLSLPEEWDYTEMGLVACLKEGRDGVRAALQELQKYGYLQRKQLRNANGKMGGTEYTVREKPLLENPTSVNPISEKTTQINTKRISTDKRSTNSIEEEEADWQAVLKAYQDNVRPALGPMDFEMLASLHKDFGKEWVLAGIEECVKSNVRNIRYLSSVLERWKTEGFKHDNRKKAAPSKKKTEYTPEGYRVKWMN
jgi:DnaD/phage-associated family protein